jgi:hypothetical protein
MAEQDHKPYDRIGKIETDVTDIKDLVTDIRISIAELKIKSGIWGAIGGLVTISIPVCIALIIHLTQS